MKANCRKQWKVTERDAARWWEGGWYRASSENPLPCLKRWWKAYIRIERTFNKQELLEWSVKRIW